MKKLYQTILLVLIFLLIMFWIKGIYNVIQDQKEIDSLQIEKLKLEIKLKELELRLKKKCKANYVFYYKKPIT